MDHCDVCGEALPPTGRGRPRRYCSRSCQGRAYRARQRSRPVVRPPRPQTLTPARLTAAAIALADAEGVEGLTMRRLSTALGVATTTLYRHFPSRDALVTAMADTVMGEIEAPDPAGTWRERLESAAWEEWKLYRRHPWVLPVLATTRPPLGPNILDAVERVLSAAADADRPPAAAMSVYLTVSGLVQGLALLPATENSAAAASGESMERWWQRQAEALDDLVGGGAFPRLTATTPEASIGDFDALFEFALTALLDGLDAGVMPIL